MIRAWLKAVIIVMGVLLVGAGAFKSVRAMSGWDDSITHGLLLLIFANTMEPKP